MQSSSNTSKNITADTLQVDLIPPDGLVNPDFRVFFGRDVTVVFGRPSKGGIYALHSCGGADLDYLGLHRLQTVMYNGTEDVAEEDGLCNKIRGLGAS
jgi:hypothetical protein